MNSNLRITLLQKNIITFKLIAINTLKSQTTPKIICESPFEAANRIQNLWLKPAEVYDLILFGLLRKHTSRFNWGPPEGKQQGEVVNCKCTAQLIRLTGPLKMFCYYDKTVILYLRAWKCEQGPILPSSSTELWQMFRLFITLNTSIYTRLSTYFMYSVLVYAYIAEWYTSFVVQFNHYTSIWDPSI